MQRILIICTLWGAGTLVSHAQTLEVMGEQLAALQTLQQATTQGYSIMTTGIGNIGQITDGEFQMHQAYFGSLAAINPSLTADPKVTTLRNLQNILMRQINAQISYWQQQQKTINRLP
jgi:hypothetical protein